MSRVSKKQVCKNKNKNYTRTEQIQNVKMMCERVSGVLLLVCMCVMTEGLGLLITA